MHTKKKKLFVTKTFLPAKDEFLKYIDGLFTSHVLTNQGELVLELEKRLAAYLHTPHVLACANGTLALMMALRQAGLGGKKVVTTPFTYVATLSAIMWEGCIPIFADIDPYSFCLSSESLRECLQAHPDIAGVVPVHIFGNCCDVLAIEAICQERGLTCIYDAAQAFGSTYLGRSLPDFGDYAICSFHATKLFHTAEGGGLVVHSAEARRKAGLLRAFGHLGDEHYTLGFNAKLSELHAAMGLANLPHISTVIEARRKACAYYEENLPSGVYIRPRLREGLTYNYSYFPIVLEDEKALLDLMRSLAGEQIFPRRYFYPSLTTLPYLPALARTMPCPRADDIAPRIMCLPLYAGITGEELAHVTGAIRRFFAG